jgi:hypothetical protein
MYYFYGPTSVLASIGERGVVAERGGSEQGLSFSCGRRSIPRSISLIAAEWAPLTTSRKKLANGWPRGMER